MKYQLLIHNAAPEGEAALGRDAATVCQLLQELHFDVPQCGISVDSVEGDNGRMLVTVASEAGEVRCGERVIRPGESQAVSLRQRLCGDGWWMQIRCQRERVGISGKAMWLVRLVAILVVLAVLAQLFLAVALPWMCRNSTLWRKQREVQEIFTASDRLRRRFEEFKCAEPTTAALVRAMQAEFAERRDFLREHALDLKPSRRRAMLENMHRIDALLDRIEDRGEAGIMPPLPELSIDVPVRNVIEERNN